MNRSVCAVFAILVVTACEFGTVEVLNPPPPEAVDVTLTLVAAESEGFMDRLGWGGVVPDAEVTITAEDGSVVWTGPSASDGSVEVGILTGGPFSLDVLRLLSAEEAEQAAEPTLAAFAERKRFHPVPGHSEVAVYPSYRSGLVLSEVYGRGHFIPGGGGSYQFATYIEIYNNSDAVQFLDGMYIGHGFDADIETEPFSCSDSYAFSQPRQTTYYSSRYARFPGSGREFAVPPGSAVVLATDAIDHSMVDPTWPDLSSAEFEGFGPSDVDNPSAANVVSMGLGFGGGRGFYPSGASILLIGPVTPASLPTKITPYNGWEWVGFPIEAVRDFVYDRGARWPLPIITPCLFPPDPAFEREPAMLRTGAYPRPPYESTHRRVIGETPEGHLILQDTRSSWADWVLADRTPGRAGY